MAAAEAGGSLAGSWALGEVGAELGLFGGPAGAIIGGIAGGVVGGVLGADVVNAACGGGEDPTEKWLPAPDYQRWLPMFENYENDILNQVQRESHP